MKEWYKRVNCSPTFVIIILVMILGVVINTERSAAALAAGWTLASLGAGCVLYGLVTLGRTVRAWHTKPAAAALERPIATAPAPARELSLAEEADALAGDSSELTVTPDGQIVKV